ncbi:unnamed protein product [Leuciscus chuanchicus]
MAFIKEESEDMKIEEIFRVKQEEIEEQTDLMPVKEESQELNEMEDKSAEAGFKKQSCQHCFRGCRSVSAALVRELCFIEGNMDSNMYCDILKQSMIPSLQKLGQTA